MFPCEDSKTVSVCPYPEKRNHHSFFNISPTLVIDTLVIDTSMERSSQVLHHGNPKIWIFFQKSSKFKFWLSTLCQLPTLVIDTSMERSSRVIQHGSIKIWFKKNQNWILVCFYFKFEIEFWLVPKRWNHSIRSQHAPIWRNRESSSSLRGSTSSLIFFQKKFEIEFWLVPKSWNHHSFINFSSTLIIDTSMERSSRVLQHGNPKIWIFFKTVRNWLKLFPRVSVPTPRT